MLRSLNEIAGEMRKASLGAGFPAGHAQELAEAASWLVSIGFDGVKSLLSGLQAGYCEAFPVLDFKSISGGHNQFIWKFIKSASHGGTFRDILLADEGNHGFELEQIDVPPLFFGLFGAFLHDKTHEIEMRFNDEKSIRLNSDLSPDALRNIASKFENNIGSIKLQLVPAKPLKNRDTYPGVSAVNGHQINEELWPQIKALAAKTYVPATEASRIMGAGAGLNDND